MARPLDRAQRAPSDQASDESLVARVLGARSGTLAKTLLQELGGLAGLERVGRQQLEEFPRLGVAGAARLSAALELGRRVHTLGLTRLPQRLDGFDAVVAWAHPRLASLDHEEVWMLALDGRNGLRAARRVAQGGLHGCALTPRDVLGPALRDAASAIVLVHNHPSGVPDPSPADVAMTRAIRDACDVVGITLLDHVVIARSGAASVLEAMAA